MRIPSDFVKHVTDLSTGLAQPVQLTLANYHNQLRSGNRHLIEQSIGEISNGSAIR